MKHVATLRLSLFVSLGLIPLACGGTALRSDDDGENAGSGGTGTASGGSTHRAGTTSRAGSSSVAGSNPGGQATGGAASGGSAAGGGSGAAPSCTSPQLDPATGLVRCGEGTRHRPSALQCTPIAGAPAPPGGGGDAGASSEPLPRAPDSPSVMCSGQPGECDQFLFGFCSSEGQLLACRSGCVTDADCGGGNVCICGAPQSPSGGICRPSTCRIDADCGPESLCAEYEGLCGGSGFACLHAEDECQTSADCVGERAGSCTFNSSLGHRYCNGAVCGRPFLVEAETRVAPVVTSATWSALDRAAPRVDHLSAAERALLAEHWTRLGQMEHASIAAFARFSLQLLALGAPPELVEACHAALADETAHARLCFQLASAYAARPIGPGPLDVSGNLLPTSLRDVVELVIAEGCFGETSAALDALRAADSASDPVIAAAYRRIANDEQRHAELAFRFVRWALQQAPHDAARCVKRALAEPPSSDLGASEIAMPCLRALLGAVEPS